MGESSDVANSEGPDSDFFFFYVLRDIHFILSLLSNCLAEFKLVL